MVCTGFSVSTWIKSFSPSDHYCAIIKCCFRFDDLFYFFFADFLLHIAADHTSENTVRTFPNSERNIKNKSANGAHVRLPQYFLSYIQVCGSKGLCKILSICRWNSLRIDGRTVDTIRREIFNLAQLSDSHRAAQSTPELAKAVWLFRIDLPEFLFPFLIKLAVFSHSALFLVKNN